MSKLAFIAKRSSVIRPFTKAKELEMGVTLIALIATSSEPLNIVMQIETRKGLGQDDIAARIDSVKLIKLDDGEN